MGRKHRAGLLTWLFAAALASACAEVPSDSGPSNASRLFVGLDTDKVLERSRPDRERFAKCVIEKALDDPNLPQLSRSNIYRFIIACPEQRKALYETYLEVGFSHYRARDATNIFEDQLATEVHSQLARARPTTAPRR